MSVNERASSALSVRTSPLLRLQYTPRAIQHPKVKVDNQILDKKLAAC